MVAFCIKILYKTTQRTECTISYMLQRRIAPRIQLWSRIGVFGLAIDHLFLYFANTHSVSPSPKKGHGKVAKKGHFERAATCQKGTFSVRRQAKGHFFKWPISCYEGTFKYRSLNLTLNI